MSPPSRFDLLLITDPSIGTWRRAIEQALSVAPASRVAVQVRAPEAASETIAEMARAIEPWCRAAGAPILVNGPLEIAAAFDGVHLREDGPEVERARGLLPAGGIVGASCHDAAGLARRAGADYVVLGPFGQVPGKGAALGARRFGELARGARPRVLALGGIDADSAGEAIAAGAAGVAVIRAVLAATDPASALRELIAAMDRARH